MYSEGLILAKRYKLCKIYGQGSFAQVWLAEDIKTQKTVAVKICHIPTSLDCEQERERFIQHFYDEIALMMHIHSYYVVEILNYGKEQETVAPYSWFYYIVMEKMNSTISNILEQQRKNERKLFTLDEFLRYAINLLIGLRDIHTQGIIHRDIKPSNLFLSSDDIAMIGDLGIAKMRKSSEETQSMFGTVGYAAPELFASEHEATIQSDIFSMGISFYEMLTTRHPCNENGSFYLSRETVQRLLSGQFYSLSDLRPDLPENLVQIIYQMIAINPQERVHSVAEVLKQFQQIRLSILNNYIELSNSYIQSNNPNEAVSVLKKSIALCPEFVKSYNRLGNLYYDYAKYHKAIKYFNKSLSFKKSKYSYNALGKQ